MKMKKEINEKYVYGVASKVVQFFFLLLSLSLGMFVQTFLRIY